MAQLIFAAYAFSQPENLAANAKEIFIHFWDDSRNASDAVIDHIQQKIGCCGINGPEDWTKFPKNGVPKSCCGNDVATCTESTAFQHGCAQLIFDYVEYYSLLIAEVAAGLALFEETCNRLIQKKIENYDLKFTAY